MGKPTKDNWHSFYMIAGVVFLHLVISPIGSADPKWRTHGKYNYTMDSLKQYVEKYAAEFDPYLPDLRRSSRDENVKYSNPAEEHLAKALSHLYENNSEDSKGVPRDQYKSFLKEYRIAADYILKKERTISETENKLSELQKQKEKLVEKNQTKKNGLSKLLDRKKLESVERSIEKNQKIKQEAEQELEEAKPAYQATRKLAYGLYRGTDFTSFNKDLVNEVTVAGRGSVPPEPIYKPEENFDPKNPPKGPSSDKKVGILKNAVHQLASYFRAIKKAPNSAKRSTVSKIGQEVRGAFTYDKFDPNMQGSLISVKTTFENLGTQAEAQAIRMSNPTIYSSKNKTRINPEFQMYLKSLQDPPLGASTVGLAAKKPRKHVYINLQKVGSKGNGILGLFNDERHRARAVHDLAHQGFDNLAVISLDENSHWREQKGKEFGKNISYAEFRDQVINRLVPDDDSAWKETGIRLNDLWDEKKYKKTSKDKVKKDMENIFDTLLKEVFITDPDDAAAYKKNPEEFLSGHYFSGNNDKEKQKARVAFIGLMYHFISDYASRESDSFNKTCKDAIDRGGAANSLTYFMTLLQQACDSKSDPEIFNKHVSTLPSYMLGDALQMRKREIIGERLQNFQTAAMTLMELVLNNKSGDGCDRIQNLKNITYLSNPEIDGECAWERPAKLKRTEYKPTKPKAGAGCGDDRSSRIPSSAVDQLMDSTSRAVQGVE